MGGERAFKRARSSEPVSLGFAFSRLATLQKGVTFAKSLCNVSLLEGGTTDGTVQIISNIFLRTDVPDTGSIPAYS